MALLAIDAQVIILPVSLERGSAPLKGLGIIHSREEKLNGPCGSFKNTNILFLLIVQLDLF